MESGVPELQKKQARSVSRTLLVALFVVYLVLLAWVVLWKLEVPWVGSGALRHIKLVPFFPSAEAGASAPLEVVANILLFVPFGVYLALLAPAWSWGKAAGVFAAASLTLEGAQYLLAVGGSDITDLLVNTAGGLAGFVLLALIQRRLEARTSSIMARVCSIVTVLALFAAVIFAVSPLRYAQRDVPVVEIGTPR